MLIGKKVGDCIATSSPAGGLGCSSFGNHESTGGDLVISPLAGADEVFCKIPFVLDAVVLPSAAIGVKILESAAKNLRQSSSLSVPSLCWCMSTLS